VNGEVREERLIDALWPDAEGDAGRFALTTTIHRLRRLLGHGEAVRRQGQKVSLDARCCWVAVWDLQELLTHAEAVDSSDRAALVSATERAIKLYQGPFLDGEAQESWATALNETLQRRLLRRIVRIAAAAECEKEWTRAASRYETALRVDPCAEDVCRRLMTCFHRAGRQADIETAYARCRSALVDRLGIPPSAQTELLMQELRGHRAFSTTDPNPSRKATQG
jgi:DNA-binding SARP family transcriptional activator